MMNMLVLHYAYKNNVKKFIGILSNCSYPDIAKSYPAKEEYFFDGPPQKTNFAYAYSKRTFGIQIKSYRKQYGCNFLGVIPCNLYGPYDNFDKKGSHFVAALIRKIHEAKEGKKDTIQLFGTGKPLRQYMYSEDLAKILKILLEKYDGEGPINIAPQGQNHSIKEIAKIALDVMDANNLKINFDKNYPDGQFRKDIDTEKLQKIIGPFSFTTLKEGIRKTYEWYLKSNLTYQNGG